jgi:hypothetical protein
MRQAVVIGVVLALVFGRDALNAVTSSSKGGAGASPPPLPLVDGGRSANLGVHISFCTS